MTVYMHSIIVIFKELLQQKAFSHIKNFDEQIPQTQKRIQK